MADAIDLGDFSSYVATVNADERDEVVPDRVFQWFGTTVRLRPHVAPMRFAAFYHSLHQRRVSVAEMYGLLESAIHADDFPGFCDLADEHNITGVQLLDVIGKILESLSARPTSQPSDSSDGSATTSQTSTPDSERTEQGQPSPEVKVAEDLGIPMPPATRPDARAALRLVDQPVPSAETAA